MSAGASARPLAAVVAWTAAFWSLPQSAWAGPLWGEAGSPRWWASIAGLAVGTGIAVLQIRRRTG